MNVSGFLTFGCIHKMLSLYMLKMTLATLINIECIRAKFLTFGSIHKMLCLYMLKMTLATLINIDLSSKPKRCDICPYQHLILGEDLRWQE